MVPGCDVFCNALMIYPPGMVDDIVRPSIKSLKHLVTLPPPPPSSAPPLTLRTLGTSQAKEKRRKHGLLHGLYSIHLSPLEPWPGWLTGWPRRLEHGFWSTTVWIRALKYFLLSNWQTTWAVPPENASWSFSSSSFLVTDPRQPRLLWLVNAMLAKQMASVLRVNHGDFRQTVPDRQTKF